GHTDGAVRIAVSDNGIGIPAEAASRVFDRFFRVDPAVEGSGLGLAITKRLVESGHGRIWFDSELGRGTTFFVELRVASVADPASQG
ncbi:MAG: ATP-binding protein, partial [Gemmatimonadota bacterium]